MDLHAKDPFVQFYRCFLDGVDITDRCVWASEEAGVAECNKLDEQGRFYGIGDGEERRVAREELHGKVEFRIIPEKADAIIRHLHAFGWR